MSSGFFAVLDDIAALMDDVALSSKTATRQTAGILGDDLAVNAEKATGFLSNREIPVLMKIMKGSFVNKLIILPIVFLLQFFYPPAIKALLICGGLYLAYEAAEKIIEYFFHKKETTLVTEVPAENDAALEKSKIKSAIATDFILSLEIVIIALGSVLTKSLPIQILTVTVVAIIATLGVYGIVALIVRMDDAGYGLIRKSGNKGFFTALGKFLVRALPVVIKILGVVGTLALLLVSGGIFDHYIDFMHGLLPAVPEMLRQFIYGLIVGFLVFLVVFSAKKVWTFVKN